MLLFFFILFGLFHAKMWQKIMERTDRENKRARDEVARLQYIISFGGDVFYSAELPAIIC